MYWGYGHCIVCSVVNRPSRMLFFVHSDHICDSCIILVPTDEDFALSTSPLESGSDPQLKPTATAWQSEFLPVAESLLNRIQAHYTPLVPLPPAEESFDTSVPSVQESFDAEESMDDLPTPSP